MFARVTKFQMKSDSMDAATALMEQLKTDIMGMPGIHNFINVMNDDGSGYVVSIVESEETSNNNAPKVAALWEQFADHLMAPPEPAGFDVIANWSN